MVLRPSRGNVNAQRYANFFASSFQKRAFRVILMGLGDAEFSSFANDLKWVVSSVGRAADF